MMDNICSRLIPDRVYRAFMHIHIYIYTHGHTTIYTYTYIYVFGFVSGSGVHIFWYVDNMLRSLNVSKSWLHELLP